MEKYSTSKQPLGGSVKKVMPVLSKSISPKVFNLLAGAFFTDMCFTKPVNYDVPLEMFQLEKSRVIKVTGQTVYHFDGFSSYSGPGLKLSQRLEQDIKLTNIGQKLMLKALRGHDKLQKLSDKKKFQVLVDFILQRFGEFSFDEEWVKYFKIDTMAKKKSWLMILLALEAEGYGKLNMKKLSFTIPWNKNHQIFRAYAKTFKVDLNDLGEAERKFLSKGHYAYDDFWETRCQSEDYPSVLKLILLMDEYYGCIDRAGILSMTIQQAKRIRDRKKPFPTKEDLDACPWYGTW